MSGRFKNKYRVESARLKSWDYGWNASYFITICTPNYEHLFGKIIRHEMVLSEIGQIALQEWEKSFEMRSELFCDAFVIMPNHIHAIVRIEKTESDGGDDPGNKKPVGMNGNGETNDNAGTNAPVVETHGRASLPSPQPPEKTEQPSKRPHGVAYRSPKSISSFVAGFKSAATKRINQFRDTPGCPVWQTRFHDHIIRDEKSYNRIMQYIINNPALWREDVYNEQHNV